MSAKDDGGPAFPSAKGWWNDSRTGETLRAEAAPGMSLRDYFAAFIASGDAACGDGWALASDVRDSAIKNRAQLYYRIADAMLAEKKK